MRFRLTGTTPLAPPPAAVWPLLLDHEFIGHCSDGIDSIERVTDTHFFVRTEVAIGPFTLHFPLDVHLRDLTPARTATMHVSGEAPGMHVRATSTIQLKTNGTGTSLEWTTDTRATGMVARVAGAVVRKLTETTVAEFWDVFAREAPARVARGDAP
jgi:carbon monoxide dehydrogenase subunit G